MLLKLAGPPTPGLVLLSNYNQIWPVCTLQGDRTEVDLLYQYYSSPPALTAGPVMRSSSHSTALLCLDLKVLPLTTEKPTTIQVYKQVVGGSAVHVNVVKCK